MAAEPLVSVLAVAPTLEVSVETSPNAPDDPQIHVHPGGQGLWVARMVNALGARTVVCAAVGGETGTAVEALARAEGLDLRVAGAVGISARIIDYRDDERDELVVMRSPELDRHSQDDLYGTMLAHSLHAELALLTGADQDLGLPADFFGRLADDLRASQIPVVADLSGQQAHAVVEAGGVVLKISHEELLEGGFAENDDVAALRRGAEALIHDGAAAVVVSRAADPTLLVEPGAAHLLRTPAVTTKQHQGAGDSMTAGIGAALSRGLSLREAVRLGAAAGALNVTRRGLGTGGREQIELLADQVEVEPL